MKFSSVQESKLACVPLRALPGGGRPKLVQAVSLRAVEVTFRIGRFGAFGAFAWVSMPQVP